MVQVEVEAPPSLHEFVFEELEAEFGDDISSQLKVDRDGIYFDYCGDLSSLVKLRTATSAYVRLAYTIPRPKSLLGHENFQKLLQTIAIVRRLYDQADYKTFAISAAGSGSSVMQRIKTEVQNATGLLPADSGDLLLRIKRTKEAWVVLVRLSPRPLVTRSWRRCDMQGALNGVVAHIMAVLSDPSPNDTICNLMCGSATLSIERMIHSPWSHLIAIDNDPKALVCAKENLQQYGKSSRILLVGGDAKELPISSSSVNVILSDLPFGSLIGNHDENVITYPMMLREAARIAKDSARFILLTHEIKLLRQCLDDSQNWTILRDIPISLRGLNPHIFVLQKSHRFV